MVPARGDVVQDCGVCVKGGVEEADGALAGVGTLLVDEGDDAAEHGGRCGSAVDQAEATIDRDDVVCAVGGDVGVAAHGLRIIVLRRGVGRLVVGEVGGYG